MASEMKKIYADVIADTIHTKADIKGGLQAAQITSNEVVVALRKAGYRIIDVDLLRQLDRLNSAFRQVGL